jgi:transposase
MSIRRYQQTLNRQQDMLLPVRVEEFVNEHNRVRAIDAYVNTLDLPILGFKNTRIVISAGQPPYPPQAMLKLYLYGYLQGIRSSRQLESETQRNLEVIWLIAGLRPCYKSIAEFRKHNSTALKAANRDFLLLCKELALLGGEEVAVDGSFFKADANKAGIYTEDNWYWHMVGLFSERNRAGHLSDCFPVDLSDGVCGRDVGVIKTVAM